MSSPDAELDFHMSRYTAVSGISTIITGLGYVGMIKIKIPVSYIHSALAHLPVFVSVLTFAADLFSLGVCATNTCRKIMP